MRYGVVPCGVAEYCKVSTALSSNVYLLCVHVLCLLHAPGRVHTHIFYGLTTVAMEKRYIKRTHNPQASGPAGVRACLLGRFVVARRARSSPLQLPQRSWVLRLAFGEFLLQPHDVATWRGAIWPTRHGGIDGVYCSALFERVMQSPNTGARVTASHISEDEELESDGGTKESGDCSGIELERWSVV